MSIVDLRLQQWLDMPPLPEEIKGGPHDGYYLGIDTVKAKILFMERTFGVTVNQCNMRHTLFSSADKQTYSSATIEIEIWKVGNLFKRLVGASTINCADYNDGKGEFYANISKSLAIANAMLEFEQFGASLNKQDVVRVQHIDTSKKKTSRKANDTLKQILTAKIV